MNSVLDGSLFLSVHEEGVSRSAPAIVESTSALVSSLNDLLTSLGIPISLASPLDLTPTLLLAILESTLESRLPLPPGVREAHTPQTKVEAVKIFLGVLGNDVLGVDLSQVDPRKLARGEWDECVYVGGLLVHVAKKEGLMGDDEAIVDVDPEVSVSDVLDEEGISEGLPTLLPWSTPPPSITRGRSGAGTPVASMSTTRARSTPAVGEDRNPDDGGAARILDMVRDLHGAITSTPRIQRTGGLGSRSFMAYKPANLRPTRRPPGEHLIPVGCMSTECTQQAFSSSVASCSNICGPPMCSGGISG